jgi:hypothetical protein
VWRQVPDLPSVAGPDRLGCAWVHDQMHCAEAAADPELGLFQSSQAPAGGGHKLLRPGVHHRVGHAVHHRHEGVERGALALRRPCHWRQRFSKAPAIFAAVPDIAVTKPLVGHLAVRPLRLQRWLLRTADRGSQQFPMGRWQ